MAGATLTALPVVVFFLIVQRHVVGGLTAGRSRADRGFDRAPRRSLPFARVHRHGGPDWILRRAAAGLGGVCLYARNVSSPEQLAALTARLHAENPRLVIAIDEEGGDVTRLEAASGSSYPGNLALGAVDDLDLTRAVARSMGADLAAAGIDLDLAPVAT